MNLNLYGCKLFHKMSFLSKKLILAFLLKHIKKLLYYIFRYIHTYGWRTFCSPEHCAPWNPLQTHTLLPTTFYSSTHFAPRNTLPFKTVCSPEHSAPWNTLLSRTLLFSAHFAFWNIVPLGTHGSLVTFPPQYTLHHGPL